VPAERQVYCGALAIINASQIRVDKLFHRILEKLLASLMDVLITVNGQTDKFYIQNDIEQSPLGRIDRRLEAIMFINEALAKLGARPIGLLRHNESRFSCNYFIRSVSRWDI
jgi:hypothetical protein